MSIASELTALNGYILGAYDEINTKGGTVPANKNMANLASAIGSISTGSSTTITPLSVTENGTYTAPTGTAYSPVTVNVSGGGSGNWAEVLSGNSTTLVDDGITALRNYALGVVGNVSDRGYLTTVSFPSVTRIGDYSFYYQTKLVSAVFSSGLSYIGSYAFSNCGKLTELYCKNVTNIYQQAFYDCTSLREVIMPRSSGIPQYVCGYCSSLVKADFGSENNSTIGNGAFSGCNSLETLVIRKTNAVLTGRSSMFPSGCPIAAGTGYIYVPSALVDSYKAARYWSTYASQIRAIEDYSSDGTVNGDINV